MCKDCGCSSDQEIQYESGSDNNVVTSDSVKGK
jgi:hypothetical protein